MGRASSSTPVVMDRVSGEVPKGERSAWWRDGIAGMQSRVQRLPKRPETGPHVFDERLWLLPCGEVSAVRVLSIEDELGVRFLHPAPRHWAGYVLWEHAYDGGNVYAFRTEE